MIRLILTVALTLAATLAWILFNPYNTARIILQKTALLERLQKSHDIYPVLPPDLAGIEPAAGAAASPRQPTREERITSLTSRIATLKKETTELQQVANDLKDQRNQGAGIAPSTILAIHQKIASNKAQIAALEQQLTLLQ